MDEDLEELESLIRVGAERRGLPIMQAFLLQEPAAVFLHQDVEVDDVLDLAQRRGVPFLVLNVSRSDSMDLIAAWEGDEDSLPPAELIKEWEAREGQIDQVSLQWLDGTAHYLYRAVPAWKQALLERQAAWNEDQEEDRQQMRAASRQRIHDLTTLLEQDSAYRAGNDRTRRSIGIAFLQPLLQSKEGPETIHLVLQAAGKLVRANADKAASNLMANFDQLAEELAQTPDWQMTTHRTDQTAVARDFLLKKAGGYAPPKPLVTDLCTSINRKSR